MFQVVKMILLLWKIRKNNHKSPITLEVGEVEHFDYAPAAQQAYEILNLLCSCNLIFKMPYRSPNEIECIIRELIDDIDLGYDELQISEKKHLRVEFRDELLSLEVYIGI